MRCGTAGCGMDRGWYGIEKAGNRTNGKRQAGMQGAGVQGCGRSVYRDRAVFSDKGCWRDGRRIRGFCEEIRVGCRRAKG